MCSRTNMASPSLAEVGRPAYHHHSDGSGRADHRLAFSAWWPQSSPVRASADLHSDAFGFDLDAPTSCLAMRCAVLRSWPATATDAMASTTAGTNGGSSIIGVGNRRACRRQVNTCCGGGPCRLAISETTASGTSVSSTFRTLSSLED